MTYDFTNNAACSTFKEDVYHLKIFIKNHQYLQVLDIMAIFQILTCPCELAVESTDIFIGNDNN